MGPGNLNQYPMYCTVIFAHAKFYSEPLQKIQKYYHVIVIQDNAKEVSFLSKNNKDSKYIIFLTNEFKMI